MSCDWNWWQFKVSPSFNDTMVKISRMAALFILIVIYLNYKTAKSFTFFQDYVKVLSNGMFVWFHVSSLRRKILQWMRNVILRKVFCFPTVWNIFKRWKILYIKMYIYRTLFYKRIFFWILNSIFLILI